jgi:predicted DNA-binding transcriptional regulator AlpA
MATAKIRPPSVDAEVLEPLAVGAQEAARLVGIAPSSWYRLLSRGLAPAGLRLGGRVLWSVDTLRRWIAAGCPDASAWDRQRPQKKS